MASVTKAIVRGRLGAVEVETTKLGVRRARFVEEKEKDPPSQGKTHAEAQPALDALKRFLNEENVDLQSVPIDWSAVLEVGDKGTFMHAVYQSLMKVDFGKRVSYGTLAASAGNAKACRAAGMAMAKNPIVLFLPCHRVVQHSGAIGNYSACGGSELKQKILDMEMRLSGESGRDEPPSAKRKRSA